MKKSLLVLVALLVAASAQATVLDKLKKTPVNQYELGALKLEFGAYFLTEKFKGKRLGSSKFDIEKFYIKDDGEKLYFVVKSVGKAKYMNDETCRSYQESMKSTGLFNTLLKDTWPNLTPGEYEALAGSVLLSTELTSKENSSFTINCS